MLQFDRRCQNLEFGGYTVFSLFGERIPDVDSTRLRRAHYFPLLCFHDTRPYTRCASLSRHSTSSRGERHQSQLEELSSHRIRCRALGEACTIGEYVSGLARWDEAFV